MKKKHKKINWHKIKTKIEVFTDIACFVVLAGIAGNIVDNARHNTTGTIMLTDHKAAPKKQHISKGASVNEICYKLTPKNKYQKYYYKTNAYGFKQKHKYKHPKVKYQVYFYLDPNYASKDLKHPIRNNIYLLINGAIVPKEKTQKEGDVDLGNTGQMFSAKKHYTLDDRSKYLKVMQFNSYLKYGKLPAPNVPDTALFSVASLPGSIRYLKTDDFHLERVKENESKLATQNTLFCGIEQ